MFNNSIDYSIFAGGFFGRIYEKGKIQELMEIMKQFDPEEYEVAIKAVTSTKRFMKLSNLDLNKFMEDVGLKLSDIEPCSGEIGEDNKEPETDFMQKQKEEIINMLTDREKEAVELLTDKKVTKEKP